MGVVARPVRRTRFQGVTALHDMGSGDHQLKLETQRKKARLAKKKPSSTNGTDLARGLRDGKLGKTDRSPWGDPARALTPITIRGNRHFFGPQDRDCRPNAAAVFRYFGAGRGGGGGGQKAGPRSSVRPCAPPILWAIDFSTSGRGSISDRQTNRPSGDAPS